MTPLRIRWHTLMSIFPQNCSIFARAMWPAAGFRSVGGDVEFDHSSLGSPA